MRNEILRATERLGCAIWARWSGYHRRGLVEVEVRCVKLMGERVLARDLIVRSQSSRYALPS